MDRKKEARAQLYGALVAVALAEREAESFADLPDKEAAGILLFAARRMRELSLQELQRISGVHFATIWRIESGRQKPQPRTIRDLARALKIPEWQLDPDQAFADDPAWQERHKAKLEVTEKEEVSV